MGETAEICFDRGAVALTDIARRVFDMWSDLGFDEAALARLLRDGLALDGLRLRGPCPYRIDSADGQAVRVRVEQGAPAELLVDLWHLHFAKGLRPGSLAA